MASRIGNHIEFPNYSADELVEIGKVMCRELEYDLGPDAEPARRRPRPLAAFFMAYSSSSFSTWTLGRMEWGEM